MKKIILVACLLVLLAGCNNQQQTNQKEVEKTKQTTAETEKKQTEPVVEKKETTTVKPQTNTNIYQNDEYGFQITLTNNWKGYKTKIEKIEGDKTIRFCANIPDSEMYTEVPGFHCLFGITITDKVKWDKEAEPCKKDRDSGMCDWIDNELGRNDKYVFSWGAAQDYGDKEEKYFQDISTIVDSFKIIKK
jgi:hypothetical protein